MLASFGLSFDSSQGTYSYLPGLTQELKIRQKINFYTMGQHIAILVYHLPYSARRFTVTELIDEHHITGNNNNIDKRVVEIYTVLLT